MTLAEWLEKWYNVYIADTGYAPSTEAMYRRAIEAIPSQLGDILLSELKPMDVYAYIKARTRLTPRAAQLDLVMLRRALRCACKQGLRGELILDEDTCPAPVHKPRETQTLTDDQVARYIEHVYASDVAPLLLLCLCGLRRGEALGVRWKDIDLASGVLRVTGQRQRIDGKYLYRPLKTEKSQRAMVMPELLIRAISTWPRQMQGGYLCDVTPEKLQKEHRKVLASAGLPNVTLHGLRHTFATLAAAQGVPMKHLQMALGHASYKLTADLYADHLTSLSSVQSIVYQRFAG